MVARYNKSKKHKKLKSVDPSAKLRVQVDAKKLKRVANKEKIKIQKFSDQNMPKRMVQILNFKDTKAKKKSKTEKFNNSASLLKIATNLTEGDGIGATRPVKAIPSLLKQGPYETEANFLRRLDRLCENVRQESKIEAKYNLGDDKIDFNGGTEKKTSNKILRRRIRDKKRKAKRKKKGKYDNDFVQTSTNIFLPV